MPRSPSHRWIRSDEKNKQNILAILNSRQQSKYQDRPDNHFHTAVGFQRWQRGITAEAIKRGFVTRLTPANTKVMSPWDSVTGRTKFPIGFDRLFASNRGFLTPQFRPNIHEVSRLCKTLGYEVRCTFTLHRTPFAHYCAAQTQ